MWSFILFALGALYLIGVFIEFPFMYEGNPKTRYFIKKMGRRNFKIMLFIFGIAFIIGGFLLR